MNRIKGHQFVMFHNTAQLHPTFRRTSVTQERNRNVPRISLESAFPAGYTGTRYTSLFQIYTWLAVMYEIGKDKEGN